VYSGGGDLENDEETELEIVRDRYMEEH